MAAAGPVTAQVTGNGWHSDSGAAVTVTAPQWVTVTEAMTRAGVSRRTVRRWIAAGSVTSRLETEDGREVRYIRSDTLPPFTGDVTPDNTGDTLSAGAAAGTGDDTQDSHRDVTEDVTRDTVTRQAEEIAFLRSQIERRDQAEAELRRLLLVSQQALQLALERPALPPAIEPAAPREKRLRWYWPFGRR